MADRSPASITIGGALSRVLLPAFLEALVGDRLCFDYGDRPIEESDIIPGQPLYGAAVGVAGGAFDETEAFCQAHGLTYICRSDACAGAWDPSIAVYPGTGDVCSFEAISSGATVITLEDVRRLGSLAAIEAHFAAADVEPGPLLIVEPNGGHGAEG